VTSRPPPFSTFLISKIFFRQGRGKEIPCSFRHYPPPLLTVLVIKVSRGRSVRPSQPPPVFLFSFGIPPPPFPFFLRGVCGIPLFNLSFAPLLPPQPPPRFGVLPPSGTYRLILVRRPLKFRAQHTVFSSFLDPPLPRLLVTPLVFPSSFSFPFFPTFFPFPCFPLFPPPRR